MRNVLAYHAILFLSLNWSALAIASVDSNIETNKSLSCEETVDFAYKLSLITVSYTHLTLPTIYSV